MPAVAERMMARGEAGVVRIVVAAPTADVLSASINTVAPFQPEKTSSQRMRPRPFHTQHAQQRT
jgi:hypothetical protein